MGKISKIPIKFTLFYLIGTLLLFLFGPLKFKVPSKPLLVLTVLAYCFSLYLGYCFAIRTDRRRMEKLQNWYKQKEFSYASFDDFSKVKVVFCISCVYLVISRIVTLLHYGVDFSYLFYGNIAMNYFERVHSEVVGRWYNQFFNLTKVISFFWYPIAILYFKDLKRNKKYLVLFIITAITEIAYFFLSGTVITIGNYIIMLIPTFLMMLCKRKNSGQNLAKKQTRKRIVVLILLVLVFLFVFNFVQQERYSFMGYQDVVFSRGNMANFIEEENNWPLFGNVLKTTQLYLTHGYVGMAYAMKLPPKFCYFLGSYRSMSTLVGSFSNLDINSQTYTQRVEDAYGWTNGMYWPTAFTWFASDWTFYGIPILMFLIGIFLYKLWVSVLTEKSIISYTLFSWIWVGIIFLPCNNQLFQSLDMFMGTTVLLLLYCFRKHLPLITIKIR